MFTEVLEDAVPKESERDRKLVLADLRLDNFFGKTYTITHTSTLLRLTGIDRIFTTKLGHKLTVDYYHSVSEDSNVFIEIHVGHDLPGWLYTNLNQVTAINSLHLKQVVLVDFMKLKREVSGLVKKKAYSLKSSPVSNICVGVNIPLGIIAEWGKLFNLEEK